MAEKKKGSVYEASGEDFSFEPLLLPVHSAGGLAEGRFSTHCQLMSCDRSIRRPLFFSGGLRAGALQVGYNQRVMDKCPADPVVRGPQTKTPRRTARRLERKARFGFCVILIYKQLFRRGQKDRPGLPAHEILHIHRRAGEDVINNSLDAQGAELFITSSPARRCMWRIPCAGSPARASWQIGRASCRERV